MLVLWLLHNGLVLGARNAVKREPVAVGNTTVVNTETMCELLRKIAEGEAVRGAVSDLTEVEDLFTGFGVPYLGAAVERGRGHTTAIGREDGRRHRASAISTSTQSVVTRGLLKSAAYSNTLLRAASDALSRARK
jgi:hypothetical protein